MIRTSTGSISVRKITPNASPRPGHRKNATANADSTEITILPTAIAIAIPNDTSSIRHTGCPWSPFASTSRIHPEPVQIGHQRQLPPRDRLRRLRRPGQHQPQRQREQHHPQPQHHMRHPISPHGGAP